MNLRGFFCFGTADVVVVVVIVVVVVVDAVDVVDVVAPFMLLMNSFTHILS